MNCFDWRGPIIIAGNDDGSIKVYDTRTAVATNKLNAHKVWVSDIQFNPLNSYLFSSVSFDK